MKKTGMIRESAIPPLGLGFFAITLLPTTLFYFGWSSSLGTGTLIACAISSGLLLTAVPRGEQASGELLGRILPPWLLVSSIMLGAISAHALFASLFQPFDVARAAVSAAMLPILLLGGWSLAVMVVKAPPGALVSAARWIVVPLLLAAILASAGLWVSVPTAKEMAKPIFPFTEPSHMVLAMMPFYAIATIGSRGAVRASLLAVGPVVILAIENLTFAVGWIIVFAACARRSLILLAALLFLAAMPLLDLRYFVDRLTFSGTDNLSALVFLQGWELMAESLARSSGWGLGFQQLGVHGTQTASSYLIFALLQADANILDGGFTAAKLISEFGLFGILLVAWLLFLGMRSFLNLRRMVRLGAATDQARLFVDAVQIALLVELMVRGTGYFTGPIVVLLGALVIRFGYLRGVGADISAGRTTMLQPA